MTTSPLASISADELNEIILFADGPGADWREVCGLTLRELRGLIARLRAAEKDAARYRWLRDEALHVSTESPAVVVADEFGNQCEGILYEERLDAAIDLAMEQQP